MSLLLCLYISDAVRLYRWARSTRAASDLHNMSLAVLTRLLTFPLPRSRLHSRWRSWCLTQQLAWSSARAATTSSRSRNRVAATCRSRKKLRSCRCKRGASPSWVSTRYPVHWLVAAPASPSHHCAHTTDEHFLNHISDCDGLFVLIPKLYFLLYLLWVLDGRALLKLTSPRGSVIIVMKWEL